ncbi:MAG: tetratricopeptide repeat protein [Candidatus Omnitrophica bacterium]|nr:tetratricopeptide repeat protein [Candidatus Omnitrophota bacterium]
MIFVLLWRDFSWGEDFDYLWESFLKGDYHKVINTSEGLGSKGTRDKLSADFYYLLGMSYLQIGDSILARNNFNFLLEKYAQSEWRDYAKLALGDSFFIEHDFTKAAEFYQNFIEKNKKSPLLSLAYFKLAETKRKQGLWEEAKKLYEKIKSVFPHSLEAKLSRDIISNNEFFFTLQVGSFLNKENANKLVEELNAQDFPAYLSGIAKSGQVYYRVRVGKFLNRSECENTRKRLIKAGYTPYLYP